jgi:hypothetical protein
MPYTGVRWRPPVPATAHLGGLGGEVLSAVGRSALWAVLRVSLAGPRATIAAAHRLLGRRTVSGRGSDVWCT